MNMNTMVEVDMTAEDINMVTMAEESIMKVEESTTVVEIIMEKNNKVMIPDLEEDIMVRSIVDAACFSHSLVLEFLC